MPNSISAPPRAKGNRVAVLCGIAKFPNAKEFPPLARVADEIDELKELLTTRLHKDFQYQLFNKTVYRDDRLTTENLLKLLRGLREYRNVENLFFYLAGHGHRHEGATYFLTYDAAPPFLANAGVRLDDLRTYLDKLDAPVTMAVLDFCHSGDIPHQSLERLSILASSQGDQVSDAGGKSSSFTKRLIEAIQSTTPDDDGIVSWERIAIRAQREHARTSPVAKPMYAEGAIGDYEFDWRSAQPDDGCRILSSAHLVHPGMYGDIQREFRDKVYATPTAGPRRVRVFGFTYAVFWTLMREVLLDPALSDWVFDLHCISPEFVNKNQFSFAEQWLRDSRDRVQEMRSWFDSGQNAEHLRKRNINVRLRSFDLLPFLHGKLFGDGTIFFHAAQWDQAGRLSYPNTFHEIVPETANSPRASAYRGLFGNWVRKYDQSIHETIYASSDCDWATFEAEMNHRLELLEG
jgi:Caspase domain